tara:strand:- start:203 stop:475 length:273 start_codon:yes stop_codon:yes gene_type:complete
MSLTEDNVDVTCQYQECEHCGTNLFYTPYSQRAKDWCKRQGFKLNKDNQFVVKDTWSISGVHTSDIFQASLEEDGLQLAHDGAIECEHYN